MSKPTKTKTPTASVKHATHVPKAKADQLVPTPKPVPLAELPMPDFEKLTENSAKLMETLGEATAASIRPIEQGETKPAGAEAMSELVKTLGKVVESVAADPQKLIMAQTSLTKDFLDLWVGTLKKTSGEDAKPIAEPDASDKRFKDPEWKDNPAFNFLQQAYLITSRWAENLVENAEDLDPHTKHKAQFYVRQLSSAFSPTNFVATNPELIRKTFSESGDNLVRGMEMMVEDIKAGKGSLKLRQSAPGDFKVGVNLANTPGKVVFRNDLIELIQYAPTTTQVYKRPLLIVPPWINKFYILDLNPDKSFIRWAVSEGLTVFTISWVNPDERQAQKSFSDYMREGVFAALDEIEKITGEKQVTAMGYCVGGTLLSVALSYMAATGDNRIASATLLTTQVDFENAGDLKVFVDEEQIKTVEDKMDVRGYLEGASMAAAFNMLRPNDLIWPYVVNVYLKGENPFPFDLLYWNADSTRMPAANHSFYLRNCYLDNKLSQGQIVMDNVRLDLSKVEIPIFNLAAREDHIAPAKSVFIGSKFFGGKVDYVLAGSGHIAGVINPVSKPKYQYWTGGPVDGEYEDWVKNAKETPGSWWPHWIEWIAAQAPDMVEARDPGGRRPTLGDAPGEFVKVRA